MILETIPHPRHIDVVIKTNVSTSPCHERLLTPRDTSAPLSFSCVITRMYMCIAATVLLCQMDSGTPPPHSRSRTDITFCRWACLPCTAKAGLVGGMPLGNIAYSKTDQYNLSLTSFEDHVTPSLYFAILISRRKI